jgi:hypothetical protein
MKYEDINPETEKYILEEFKTDSIIIDKIPHTEYIAKAKDLICQLSMRFVKREYQFYLEAEIADYKEIATIENRKIDRNFISPGSIYLDIFGERPADKKTAIILLYEIIVKTYSATMGSERLFKKFAAGFDVIMPNIIDRNDLELLYCRAGPTFENVLVTLCSLINDNYAPQYWLKEGFDIYIRFSISHKNKWVIEMKKPTKIIKYLMEIKGDRFYLSCLFRKASTLKDAIAIIAKYHATNDQ